VASHYGTGSIYKDQASGLWVGIIELDRGPGGRRRRKWCRARTKAELLVEMREVQMRKDQGLPEVNRQTTVAEWSEIWLTQIAPGRVKPSTLDSYRECIETWVLPYVGTVPLAKLGPEHVQAMMNALESKGLSPRTRAYARGRLAAALKHAERWGKVTRNAAYLVDAPKKAATKIDDALTPEEAQQVLDTVKGDRLEALAMLVLATGLRQGEALALRWDDLALDGPTPTLTVREAKTDAGRRTIALPGFVAAALREQRAAQRVERMAAQVWVDPDLVFTTKVGTAIDGSNALYWWYALTIRALGNPDTSEHPAGSCRTCGTPLTGRRRAWCSQTCRSTYATRKQAGRRRFHASRHTAATLMLNAGVPLEVVSATLGHAGLAITADIYAKVRPELQRTAATAMDNLLGSTR